MLRNFKYLFVIFLLIQLFPKTGLSQFLNKNATWFLNHYVGGDGNYFWHSEIKIEKDSIVNNINYSIFKEKYGFTYALREDSARVYSKVLKHDWLGDIYDTLEHVLYDFNLLPGDSIQLYIPTHFLNQYKWAVLEVDSIPVGFELKKRILLRNANEHSDSVYSRWSYGLQYWIQDIGSTYGPLYFTGITGGEYSVELCSYKINATTLYGDSCILLENNENQVGNNFQFNINQNTKILEICINKQEEFNLNIYSITGILLYVQQDFNNSKLNLAHLKPGIYIAVLKTNSHSFSKKFILH